MECFTVLLAHQGAYISSANVLWVLFSLRFTWATRSSRAPFHSLPLFPFASHGFWWIGQVIEQLPSIWVLLSALELSFYLSRGTIWIKICQVGRILNEGWGKSCAEPNGKSVVQLLCLPSVTAHSCSLWDPFFFQISSPTPLLQVSSTSSLLNWVNLLCQPAVEDSPLKLLAWKTESPNLYQ